ncbi:nucleoside triphosphate hydrolase protein [Wolfiporia cocos MD-104 SS10]|uniref:Nucleoside triphosphate hydrolase protein n=1 Tax=Wolfiporia cocos (strain MD-104) TaxID=742152 RepID=A0A2H3JPC1_WOLCO|nr:nucleoside triphosphate hydrolase protein [Wolfiporia cocos MD-104 SS10]
MPSPRNTILGKRPHQSSADPISSSDSACDLGHGLFLPTPDPTPNAKRPRISVTQTDDDSNKENIPPFVGEVINGPSPRSTRSLRRTTSSSSTTRSRNTPRRRASATPLLATPSSSSSADSSLPATPPPTPPSVLLPLHVRARALLRPTCNSLTDIAGRHSESDVVQKFITSFLNGSEAEQPGSSVLYISGSPGTGKTALVNAVLHKLHEDLEDHQVTLVSVNCMALNGVDAIWARLAEDLDVDAQRTVKGRRGRKLKEAPSQLVERLLVERGSKCIILLDELDHITSCTQSLNSLFTLANAHASNLRLIGIANTHTLTSSSSTTLSVQSLTGVKTLHFAPYTPQQLLQILTARLSPLLEDPIPESAERAKKFLPTPTLTLLTKKVASQTGDVRATFEVLRGAIDLAVAATVTPDSLDMPAPVVTPPHILSALKAHSPAAASARPAKFASATAPAAAATASSRPVDSEIVAKVRGLGLQSRLVLLVMLLARKRLDAGLTLSGSLAASGPSPPRSPIKRTASMSAAASPRKAAPPPPSTSMDTTQLHAFYSAILTRSDAALFAPVSRSEFGDLLGVLETVGLVLLSSAGGMPGTPSKTPRKGLKRTTSFNAGKGSQDVRLVETVRTEEVARGLGIAAGTDASNEAPAAVDVREEEVCAIWEREHARIARETKAMARAAKPADVFEDAMEA